MRIFTRDHGLSLHPNRYLCIHSKFHVLTNLLLSHTVHPLFCSNISIWEGKVPLANAVKRDR